MALYNHSADDGVNWAHTDAPSLLRMGDLALFAVALILLTVVFGEAGLVLFGLLTGIYLLIVVSVRQVLRVRRAWRMDCAINALGRADFPQGTGLL